MLLPRSVLLAVLAAVVLVTVVLLAAVVLVTVVLLAAAALLAVRSRTSPEPRSAMKCPIEEV